MAYPNLDLRSLRYFCEVVRQGSMSRAAAMQRVTQPAISRQIQMLEEELGLKLVTRHQRGIEPTRERQELAREAEALLRAADSLGDRLRARAAEPSGSVSFGCFPSVSDFYMADAIGAFLKRHPKVTFEAREGYTRELRDGLLEGAIDLGILNNKVERGDLVRVPLYWEEVWLVGLPEIWPFDRPRLSKDEVRPLPLIHAPYLLQPAARGLQGNWSPNSVLIGESASMIQAAARAGVGFMLMPASAVRDDIARGRFVGAPVEGLRTERGLFRRRDRPISRAMSELIDWTIESTRQVREAHPDIMRPLD